MLYTRSFVGIRSNRQGQPLQQIDAQQLIVVVVLYAPYTGPASCTLGRRVQTFHAKLYA